METTREKLEKAQGLLKAGEYAKARKLLATINHPTAQKWLERLDEREASSKVVVRKRKRSMWYWIGIGALGLILFTLIGQALGILPTTEERNATRTAEAFAVALVATQTEMARPTETETVTPSMTFTETIAPIETEAPTPTSSMTPSETPTITYTPEHTIAPTATITDTPLPMSDLDAERTLSRWLFDQEGVDAVQSVLVIPGDRPIVYADIIVHPGYNNPLIPSAFLEHTSQAFGFQNYANFNIIISDGIEAIDYTFDNRSQNWTPVRLTMVQPPTPRRTNTAAPVTQPTRVPTLIPAQPVIVPVQPVAPVGGTCPSLSATCSQLTCDQAYACLRAGNGGLDRDNDGVPCESVCPGG